MTVWTFCETINIESLDCIGIVPALEDYSEVAHICFTGDIQQVYDIAIIPASVFPGLIDNRDSLIRHTFDFQETAL